MNCALKQGRSDIIKSQLYVLTIKSRSFLEWNIVVVLDPLLDLGLRNFTVVLLVFLVSKDEERKVIWVFWAAFLKKVMLPVAQVVKRLLAGDVIY